MDGTRYKAMQDRVELLSRLLLDTDAAELAEFIAVGERTDTIAPFMDPTGWLRGRDALRMVIEHARALSRARSSIVEAAERASAISTAAQR